MTERILLGNHSALCPNQALRGRKRPRGRAGESESTQIYRHWQTLWIFGVVREVAAVDKALCCAFVYA